MTRTIVGLVATTLLVGAYGCNGPSGSESTPPAAPVVGESRGEDADHEHSGHGDGGAMTDMEKMKVELVKLSPEDAASAEKQHFCPVSGDMLGTMGAPIKVDVNGRQVWICCEGCRESLLENPEEYLAKLKD
jgi:Cu(I)/Ag(I) efflux system membrane fusion protein